MKRIVMAALAAAVFSLSGCAVNVVTVNHANLLLDDHGTSVSADIVESNVK